MRRDRGPEVRAVTVAREQRGRRTEIEPVEPDDEQREDAGREAPGERDRGNFDVVGDDHRRRSRCERAVEPEVRVVQAAAHRRHRGGRHERVGVGRIGGGCDVGDRAGDEREQRAQRDGRPRAAHFARERGREERDRLRPAAFARARIHAGVRARNEAIQVADRSGVVAARTRHREIARRCPVTERQGVEFRYVQRAQARPVAPCEQFLEFAPAAAAVIDEANFAHDVSLARGLAASRS